MAPSFSPASVIKTAADSRLQRNQSDAFELDDWEPPMTNVQQSPSDWIPPTTDVTPSLPAFSEQAGPATQDTSVSLPDDTMVIQPPAQQPAQLPAQEQAPIEQTLVPFSDIEQSEGASPVDAFPVDAISTESASTEAVPSEPLPGDSKESGPGVNLSPKIPPTAEISGDELIEFDGDCLECEQSAGDLPLESGAAGGIADERVRGPIAAVGAGAVKRTIGAGRNSFGKIHSGGVNGEPRLLTPVRNVLGTLNYGLAGNEAVHAVGSLTFLSFARNYRGRGRQLTFGSPNLFANGPDEGNFTGVDLSYGRRRAGGRGWEARYIGFDPGQESDVASSPSLIFGGFAPPLNDPASFGGFLNPNVPQTFGLSAIGLNGISAADVFNNASNHRVTRDSEFGSFEFNVLRASGSTLASSGGAVVELFAGLRGVSFQETTTFSSGPVQTAFLPSSALYASEVQNSLFGIQIGGRLERPLPKGWGFTFGTRVGIYNNRIESRQRSEFIFADGSRATPVLGFGDNAGEAFDFEGKGNELAFLGELDFGVTYQFRQNTRAKLGFRGIAVTNVATGAGQFQDSLFDVDEVSDPQASGDLIVGGLYFGVDHAF